MPPDADLVRDARRGSKEAMAELLRRHWDTAVLLAGRVLGSPDLARDAAQEAAVAAMAGLVEAAGSQVTEVKITRLLDSVFYACVVVPGPGGPRELDARPSDAVNLAVTSGVPIRLNSSLFSAATAHDDDGGWDSVVATADIAAEAKQRMREAAQRFAPRTGT